MCIRDRLETVDWALETVDWALETADCALETAECAVAERGRRSMYTVFIVSKRSRVGRRVGVMVSAVAVVAATMSAVIGAPPASAAPSGPSGTVVSTEPLPARITVPGAVDAKRITYWTKGVHDAAALSSGAVYLPPGTPPKGGWPVIAWAHGTTGLADHCAYSIGGPVAVERLSLIHI